MVYKFFGKKSSGSSVNESEFADELHKLIIRKF